jgi:hypothetical protein
MGDFIETGTLAGPMADAKPLPASANPSLIPNLQAARWNEIRQALIDTRAHVSGWVNVRSYGAVGDGVTDDTAAIQAAIDAAAGRSLVLPYTGSDYVISTALVASHGMRIEGTGRQVKIRQTASAPVLRLVPVDVSANDRIFGLKNLYLVNGTVGLDVAPTTYLHRQSSFQDLDFYGQTEAALDIHGGEAAVLGTTWERISVDGPATPYGIRAVGFAQLNATRWSNLLIKGTTTAAWHIEETLNGYIQPGVNLHSCDIEANAGKGLVIIGSQVNLYGCHFEQNGSVTGGADIDISGGPGGSLTSLNMHDGYFVAPSAAQSNRRIFVSGAPFRANFHSTRFTGTDIIDGNSQTSGSRVAYYGVPARPVLQNFSTGAASFDADAVYVPNFAAQLPQNFGLWAKDRSSVGVAVTAYDGTASAYKITEDSTAANSHVIRRAWVVSNGATHVYYVIAKAAGRSWIQLNAFDSGDHNAYFNLTTGAVGASASITGAITQSLGDGWWLCAIQYTAGLAATTGYVFLSTGDSGRIYDGDGASGVIVSHARMFTGAFL